MTPLQQEQLAALRGCKLSRDERHFVSTLDPARALSPNQEKALAGYAHYYRAQIGKCLAPGCARCELAAKKPTKGQKRRAKELRDLDEHNRRWG